MRFIDLFCGIGGIRIAAESVGWHCVFSCDIDSFARKTYEANFNEVPSGDITSISPEQIPSFDILTAGFPCQPFSVAGQGKGFDDTRGTLFFNILSIAEFHKPKALFLENVKGLLSHDKGNTFRIIKDNLESIGYRVFYTTLNAKDFGLPQNRDRLYIVCFRDYSIEFKFPQPLNIPTRFGDLLDLNVNLKYTKSNRSMDGAYRHKKRHSDKRNGFGFKIVSVDDQYCPTFTAHYYKGGTEILIEQPNNNPRKLTPNEARRLQGFPEGFVMPVSDTQAYKQLGNSVAIPVIKEILKEIHNEL